MPLIVPLGDITDIELVNARTLMATTWGSLLPLAKRYDVDEVIISIAKVTVKTFEGFNGVNQKELKLNASDSGNNLDWEQNIDQILKRVPSRIELNVSINFINAQGSEQLKAVFESMDGESFNEILLRTANKISKSIQDTWKQDNVLKFGLENVMRISIPLLHLRDWSEIR